MRTYSLSPLYRSGIGFNHMASLLDNLQDGNVLDSLVGLDSSKSNYPPYNIVQMSEDEYRITLAVAGFEQSELVIESESNKLTVSGKQGGTDEEANYLHRGIAARNFERRFQLADHVKVAGASYKNGLLHIDLVRELPEAMKPRTIAISSEDEPVSTEIESPQQSAA